MRAWHCYVCEPLMVDKQLVLNVTSSRWKQKHAQVLAHNWAASRTWRLAAPSPQGRLLIDLWALLSGVSTLTTEHGPRMDLGNSAYAATVIRDVGSCGARVAQTPAQCGCLPLELSPQERCFDNNDNWSVDTARISTGGECHCCPPGSFGF